jgi:hypothetical protein
MKKFMSHKMKVFLSILTAITILCYISAAVVLYNSNFNFSSHLDNWHGDWNFGWTNHNSIGTVEKDFPQTVQNINLTTTSSDCSIKFYSGSNIKIDISGDFFSNFNYSDGLSRIEVTDSNIIIETNDNLIFSDLDLTVYIPESYKNSLYLKSSSGELSVSGGNLKTLSLTSSSGDITLYDAEAADTSIEASSGSITASTFKTNKSLIKTSSGDISINGLLGETTVSASSGSVDLNLSELGAISNFSAHSGDVDLIIANEIGYKLVFSSNSGEISGKNIHMDNDMNNSYTYTNGNGSKLINVNTSSGDLDLR